MACASIARVVVVVSLVAVGSASASPKTDTARATTILNAQIAAIKGDDSAALPDTFSTDAIVLVPDPRSARAETTGLREAIARLSPHDMLRSIKVTKVVAGGNASAVWWSAELVIVAASNEPESKPHVKTTIVRLTELATADANWKVVAGAFAETRAARPRAGSSPIDDASTTAPGALTPLAGSVAKLDTALAPQAVVFGTDKGEATWDATAAHALLKRWTKLAFTVDGKPREHAGKDWAFAITNVNWQQPKETDPARMSCLVIATPSQVVAVQYTAD